MFTRIKLTIGDYVKCVGAIQNTHGSVFGMKIKTFMALSILMLNNIAYVERPLIVKVIKVIDGGIIKIETNIRLVIR